MYDPIMTSFCAKNLRESLMWENSIVVTSEELKSYAANYPSMGIYIPRGQVKVPQLRSYDRRVQQTSQSSGGKTNSQNLLMIKPGCQYQLPTSSLSAIDVHASRYCDVRTKLPRLHATSARQQQRFSKPKSVVKPYICDAKTPQLFYSGNHVTDGTQPCGITYFTEFDGLPAQPVQSVLLPPHVNPMTGNSERNEPYDANMTSLMTQEMGYPLQHEYYRHISAIAAMAWSDCNQATEKLRLIYEKTAHLSGSCPPFGLYPGGLPPTLIPAPSATGNTRNIFGQHEATLPQPLDVSTRCHTLAKDHQKYFNQTMSQSSRYASGEANPYIHCDVKRQSNVMTSQSTLPGISMFTTQCDVTRLHQHVPYDHANQREFLRQSNGLPPKPIYSRQKRKIVEQKHLFAALGDQFLQTCHPKVPRIDPPVQHFNPPMQHSTMSQSFADMTSLFPEKCHHPGVQPPPYESVLQNQLQHPIPDLLKRVVKAERQLVSNFSSVMTQNCSGDVNHTSSNFTEKLCLPSVSYSPSQLYADIPFAL